jgi:hypothetical protein
MKLDKSNPVNTSQVRQQPVGQEPAGASKPPPELTAQQANPVATPDVYSQADSQAAVGHRFQEFTGQGVELTETEPSGITTFIQDRTRPRELLKFFVDQKRKKGGDLYNEQSARTLIGDSAPEKMGRLGRKGAGQTIVSGEARLAQVGQVDAKATGELGTVYAEGAVDLVSVQGRLFGDVKIKKGAVDAFVGANGRVDLAAAHCKIGYDTPTTKIAGKEIGIKTEIKADAFVGAQGRVEAKISLSKSPNLHVGGEAFAGASASIQGQAALSDLGKIRGSASAWAGVGAKANLDVGFDDGKLKVDMGLGAALGIGASVDWGVEVDVYAVGEFAAQVGDTILDGLGDVGATVSQFSDDVAASIEQAADSVTEAVGDAVESVRDPLASVSDYFPSW